MHVGPTVKPGIPGTVPKIVCHGGVVQHWPSCHVVTHVCGMIVPGMPGKLSVNPLSTSFNAYVNGWPSALTPSLIVFKSLLIAENALPHGSGSATPSCAACVGSSNIAPS